MLWRAIPCVATLLMIATAVRAQNTPHIGYVYPAGGQRGTTFPIVVGGQFLEGVHDACFSVAGIQAVVIERTRPLTQREFNDLREKLRVLQEKRQAAMKGVRPPMSKGVDDKREGQDGTPSSAEPNQPPVWTAEDMRMVAEIRKKLLNGPNRQANPAIAERVTLTVTTSPDAEPGEHELRLVTAAGVTNPLVFCVGELPEFSENESQGSAEPQQNPRAVQSAVAKTEMKVTLPAVLNGQILPGGVDRFRFTAQKGQRIVVAAGARKLIPYLPDAVPGWFQATLALYDNDGKELAYDDDYRFNPDPVLFYEIPADGEYVIEVKDSIYRGREDFVYRITAGELPFVTSVFPLGAQAGTPTEVELQGWNLPTRTLPAGFADAEVGIHQLSVGRDAWVSNLVPFAVDALPECLERESNDQPQKAQPILAPAIINGRIDKGGDGDVFSFEGRAGREIVAEVYARRLNSPLDAILKLTDSSGRQLAANDDREDKGAGLTTHHADSYLRAALPADGTYYLHLADAQNQGGAEYGYRLRIGPPRPDFELRIVPSSINIRGGTSVPLTVYALRKDGFAGDIALALKGVSTDVVLSGGWVPAGRDKVQVTLTVPPAPTQEPLNVSLEGRAVIDGREVVHPVVPAEDMMQAFFYRHLVPARELRVAISGRYMTRAPVKILSNVPLKIPSGGTAQVRVTSPAIALTGKVQLELSEPPEGITIEKVVGAGLKSPRTGPGADIVLRSDPAKAMVGLKGNLIITAFPASSPTSDKQKVQAGRPRTPLATLPAVPFEIVP